jgi:acyl-CoA thioesterase FadM
VTARLEVDYRKPVLLGAQLKLEAWVEAVDGRKLHLCGVMRDADGELVAEARALFLVIDVEHWIGNGGGVPEALRGKLPY